MAKAIELSEEEKKLLLNGLESKNIKGTPYLDEHRRQLKEHHLRQTIDLYNRPCILDELKSKWAAQGRTEERRLLNSIENVE
jgi:hypothetical protein